MDLQVGPGRVIPEHELEFLYSRSSGPGGQNVNKTCTRVTVRWNIRASQVVGAFWRSWLLQRLASRLTADGVLQVSVDEMRSQLQNRELACERLRAMVQAACERPKIRHATKPTRASDERRLQEKRQHAAQKQNRRRPDF